MSDISDLYKKAHEKFVYKDGCLFLKVGTGRCGTDRAVGHINKDGYIEVSLDGKKIGAHRVIFLMHHGYFPENDIDHIDRSRTNNNILNLREVARSCNVINSGLRRDNTTGVTGVYATSGINSKCGAYTAEICRNKTRHRLGYFVSLDDAVMARWKAEVDHGFPNCSSSSPAYQYLIVNGLVQTGGAGC